MLIYNLLVLPVLKGREIYRSDVKVHRWLSLTALNRKFDLTREKKILNMIIKVCRHSIEPYQKTTYLV